MYRTGVRICWKINNFYKPKPLCLWDTLAEVESELNETNELFSIFMSLFFSASMGLIIGFFSNIYLMSWING